MSVVEVARVQIKDGQLEAFLDDVEKGLKAMLAEGVPKGARVLRGVESPNTCLVIITWDSVEAHESYQGSAEFQNFRAVLGAHLAAAPDVAHYESHVALES
ncbi:putative quinol monooxygenase [Rhodococcus koreensis]|uniref:putative quinol monooxygenase n=1 Tax=Rhodococcus koreensis TaxID=99653 RepID=UPI00367036DD